MGRRARDPLGACLRAVLCGAFLGERFQGPFSCSWDWRGPRSYIWAMQILGTDGSFRGLPPPSCDNH